jgi:hypothetical protein
MASLKNELSRMKSAMEDFDVEEINKSANNLHKYIQNGETGVIINKVLQYKLTGDYDEAIELIDGILLS